MKKIDKNILYKKCRNCVHIILMYFIELYWGMKSSYYDILDRYYRGFCGEGDSIDFEDTQVRIHCIFNP